MKLNNNPNECKSGVALIKKKTVTYVIALFIFLMHGLAPTVIGNANLPKWNIGDKWGYETQLTNVSAHFTVEVLDTTSINVNGTDYDVYVVRTNSEMMISGTNITNIMDNYILRSNLATVKLDITQDAPGIPIQKIYITYDPPKTDYNFPLEVGKRWFCAFNESQYVIGWGYYNFTKSISYEVVEIESITVKAGIYECYKIEIIESSGEMGYSWYSPEINNIVKTTGGIEGYLMEMELSYYSRGEKKR